MRTLYDLFRFDRINKFIGIKSEATRDIKSAKGYNDNMLKGADNNIRSISNSNKLRQQIDNNHSSNQPATSAQQTNESLQSRFKQDSYYIHHIDFSS